MFPLKETIESHIFHPVEETVKTQIDVQNGSDDYGSLVRNVAENIYREQNRNKQRKKERDKQRQTETEIEIEIEIEQDGKDRDATC